MTPEKNHSLPQPSQKIKQLLVVDDDLFIRQMLSGVLSELPINIILASSGKEALDIMSSDNIDLVLMDMKMPDMDGSSTLKKIRNKKGCSTVPVISMTARSSSLNPEGYTKDTHRLGFNAHISKPIDPQNLKRTVNHYLKPENHVNAIEKRAFQNEGKEVLDFDIAMYYVEGNQELLLTLLKNIYSDHRHDLEKFRSYQENKQNRDAQRLLHTLKGIAGTIGATELEESCENLERHLPYQSNDVARFEHAFLTLMTEIEIINGPKSIEGYL